MEETLDFNEINASHSNTRTISDVLQNGYSFTIGEAFSQGTDIFKQNVWGFTGFNLLHLVIQSVVGRIPFIGFFINIAVGPPLQAGVYLVSDKIHKNEPYDFGNFFDGFKNKYQNLVLNYLILIGLGILIAIPIVIVMFLGFGSLAFDVSDINFAGPIISFFIILVIGLFFAGSLLTFNTLLLLFQNTNPWESIITSAKITLKNYFLILGLLLLLILLNIAGALAFIVGILFTIPMSICILYAAYTLIFTNKDIIV